MPTSDANRVADWRRALDESLRRAVVGYREGAMAASEAASGLNSALTYEDVVEAARQIEESDNNRFRIIQAPTRSSMVEIPIIEPRISIERVDEGYPLYESQTMRYQRYRVSADVFLSEEMMYEQGDFSYLQSVLRTAVRYGVQDMAVGQATGPNVARAVTNAFRDNPRSSPSTINKEPEPKLKPWEEPPYVQSSTLSLEEFFSS